MSGFSNYLPFSQRPPRDESTVSNNWSSQSATVLSQLAGILGGLSDEEWTSTSVRPGSAVAVDIRRIVAELLWGLDGRGSRMIAVGRLVISKVLLPRRARAVVIGRSAEREPRSLTEETDTRASALAHPGSTATVHQLGHCVAALLEIAEVTGRPVAVDPVICGAVAIAESLSAPLAIRAVLARSELLAGVESTPLIERAGNATDGSWSVGRGSRTTAPAAAIVLFVYGRRGFPVAAAG